MTGDASAQERRPDRVNLWKLPKILSAEVVRVTYKNPVLRYSRAKKLKHKKGVEIMVRTDGPLPERAVSPVLRIGTVIIDDYEFVEKNLYRFYVFNFEKLEEGAEIELIWPPGKEDLEDEKIIYRIEREEIR